MNESGRDNPLTSPNAAYNAGVHCLRSGEIQQALAHFEKAAALAPQDADCWYAFGIAANKAWMFYLAKVALQRALSLGRRDYHCHAELADALTQLGEIDRAISAARQALELASTRPEQAHAAAVVAHLYGEQEEPEKAFPYLTQVVERDPYGPSEHYNLGVAYMEREDWDSALSHLQQAVAVQPDERFGLALAQVHLEREEMEEAESLLLPLLNGSYGGLAHLLLVLALLGREAGDAALALAEAGITQHPNCAEAWIALYLAALELPSCADAALVVRQGENDSSPDLRTKM